MPKRPPAHRQPWQGTPEQEAARRRAEHDARRPSASQRGYDADWRRCRADYLKAHPYCRFCADEGIVKLAQEVDHIASVREAPQMRLSWSNLRGLCKPHHSQRTALDQGIAMGRRGVSGSYPR